MPRTPSASIENSFVRGLITEATGLNFPENACTETYDCVFEPLGTVRRRRGFEYEHLFTKSAIYETGSVLNSYVWENVSGDGSITFVVVQVGNTLHFFAVGVGLNLSGSIHDDTVDLTDFSPAGAPSPALHDCQFSAGNGNLFVTHPFLETFYVEYDIDTDTISTQELDIQVRDLEGDLGDTLAVDGRPTATLGTLSATHHYNLLNQGWSTTNLTAWDTARSDMPSNADVSWYFKNADDEFDFTIVANKEVGNSRAPRGKFIYSLYDFDRNAEVTGATSSSIIHKRVSTSAFFAGRVFYSGLNAQGYDAKIYFTQIVEEDSQYEKCYQTNDPTSELLFDLLPSDGGVINILNGGRIIKLFPYINTLLVFTTNGVWAVSGSQGIGFTANDYSVNKISSVPAISHRSIVDVEGVPFWWNQEGIYTVQVDNNTGGVNVVSATDQTIRTFYQNIPAESKVYATGLYDNYEKIVHWLYRSVESEDIEDKYQFDRVLNFNILTRSFYPWTISETDVKTHGGVVIRGIQGTLATFEVLDGTDNIIDGTDNVVQDIFEGTPASPLVKYLVSDGSGNMTFAETRREDSYEDWVTESAGESYESYFVTGYRIRGGAQRKFQSNYVIVYSDNTIENRYKFQGIWDYATSGNTGRWSTNNIIIPQGDYTVVSRKLKVRGHGKSLQYRVTSTEDYPFEIVGWSVFETGNQLP